jgi:hypothetical protein
MDALSLAHRVVELKQDACRNEEEKQRQVEHRLSTPAKRVAA